MNNCVNKKGENLKFENNLNKNLSKHSLNGNKKKFFYSACIIKEHIIIIKLIGKIFNFTTCSPELFAVSAIVVVVVGSSVVVVGTFVVVVVSAIVVVVVGTCVVVVVSATVVVVVGTCVVVVSAIVVVVVGSFVVVVGTCVVVVVSATVVVVVGSSVVVVEAEDILNHVIVYCVIFFFLSNWCPLFFIIP